MTASGDSAPPTYDPREVGEGLAIYERLERLADRFSEVAATEVGCAFSRVPEFTAQATLTAKAAARARE